MIADTPTAPACEQGRRARREGRAGRDDVVDEDDPASGERPAPGSPAARLQPERPRDVRRALGVGRGRTARRRARPLEDRGARQAEAARRRFGDQLRLVIAPPPARGRRGPGPAPARRRRRRPGPAPRDRLAERDREPLLARVLEPWSALRTSPVNGAHHSSWRRGGGTSDGSPIGIPAGRSSLASSAGRHVAQIGGPSAPHPGHVPGRRDRGRDGRGREGGHADIVPDGTHRSVYRPVSESKEDRWMDDGQIGRLLRAVRLRRNLRQVDVARQVGVHQGVISDLELGRLQSVGLATARRVARVLDVRLVVNAFWHGGEGDRLLDRAHATLVEHVISALRAADWQVMPEFTFNVFGDRVSSTSSPWHPMERILLIVEVKSILTDLQNLLAALSRKPRVVPRAAGEQLGWRPRHVAVLVVAAGTHGNRAIVARHASTFDSALPSRSAGRADVASTPGRFLSPGCGSCLARLHRCIGRAGHQNACTTLREFPPRLWDVLRATTGHGRPP